MLKNNATMLLIINYFLQIVKNAHRVFQLCSYDLL